MAEQSVERFEQSMLFDQYLGDVDLMRHPQYTEGLYEKDKELHDSILHSMGADLSYGYEFVESTYRTRICKSIRVGVRICFKERTDKWWQQNMMDISDIVRYVSENEGTIKAVGMRESLMEDSSMHAAMVAATERFVINAEIVVKDNNDSADLIEEVK